MKICSASCRDGIFWLLFTIGLLVFFPGCEGGKIQSTSTDCGSPVARFVIVLVDETDSFGIYKEGKLAYLYWPEILPWAARVVGKLNPGDAFCLIGMDEKSSEDDDVRIPVTVLDEGTLKAITQKKALVREIKSLTRRKEKHAATDITGALIQAAEMLQKDPARKGEIIIFSDMIQEPEGPTPESIKDMNIPGSTGIHCFFVSASDMKKWNSVVNNWINVFQSKGLNVSKDDFNKRSVITMQFNKVFGCWSNSGG
jgi:hypothetical protein